MLKLTLGAWIMNLAADWILDQVSAGGVDTAAENLKDIAHQWLDTKRDDFVNLLKEKAAVRWPDTTLDEALIKAVETFLNAILPQK
jgi:hypothetical protein